MPISNVIAANAPPAITARASRVRAPDHISAARASAATSDPKPMITRWSRPLIGAGSSRERKCMPAAGMLAAPASSRRLAPTRLRSRRSTPGTIGALRAGLNPRRQDAHVRWRTARRAAGVGRPPLSHDRRLSVTNTRIRATALTAALVAALAATLLLAPAGAGAATIKACANKKTGAVRVISGKKKCKKSEKKLTWNTKGVAGTNGTNGTNGANGAPGQPQSIQRFDATLPNDGNPTALFSASGVTYSFKCSFALVLNIGELFADAASGESYGSGVFARPTGVTAQSSDIKTDLRFQTLGGGGKAIAYDTTTSSSGGNIEQNAVWTVTVEGPSATTWIHARFHAGSNCSVHGTAITVAS